MGFIGGMKNCQWTRLRTDADAEVFLTELQQDLKRDADEYARSIAYRRRVCTRTVAWLEFRRS